MPVTPNTIESLRRLAMTSLAYALAAALVAVSLPAILTPMPVAALFPKPQPVVARVPVAMSAADAAS